MGRYVIGVDGGGSKTQCALFDIDGNFIDLINWGATNHESLRGGLPEMKEEIEKILNSILTRNGITAGDIAKGAFGMAGVDTKAQHAIISGFIRGVGLQNFILCNDSFLGIKAGCISGHGICVINGTGCSVAGIDSRGKMLQIGGQGSITGDVGGGGCLGIAAVLNVYNHLFRGGQYTLLMDLLFEELKVVSKYDFIEIVTEKMNEGTVKIEEFNRFVFDAANLGDEVSLDILAHVGKELGISVNGMIQELDFDNSETLEIVLAGSINTKGSNPALVNSLKNEVIFKNTERKIKFIILDKPPVAGGVVWALNELGHTGTKVFLKVGEGFKRLETERASIKA